MASHIRDRQENAFWTRHQIRQCPNVRFSEPLCESGGYPLKAYQLHPVKTLYRFRRETGLFGNGGL